MGILMRLLLDTHVLLWWFLDDPKLSARCRALIADGGNEILVSAASAWEIATKHRLGKLGEAEAALTRYQELIEADGFTPLVINARHALMAESFEQPHRDPFDRMLAAQAVIEAVPLATADPAFAQFPVDTLW